MDVVDQLLVKNAEKFYQNTFFVTNITVTSNSLLIESYIHLALISKLQNLYQ